jgi:DNA-binding LytR/AlgR family response regulator
MKLNFSLFIIVLLLSACGHSDKQLINEAETLLESNPDSALLVLSNVEDADNLSDEYTARYWMATATAHQALSQSLSEDSMILFAVDYYRQHEPIDSAKLRQARELASDYYWLTKQNAEAVSMLEQSLQEVRSTGNKEATAEVLYDIAALSYFLHDDNSHRKYSYEIINLDTNGKRNIALYNALSFLYYTQGQDSLAIDAIEHAIALKKADTDSVVYWGIIMSRYVTVLIDAGQTDRGIEIGNQLMVRYQKAPQIYADYINEVHLSLAHAWLNKGDMLRAQQHLNKLTPHEHDKYQFCPQEFYKRVIKTLIDYHTTNELKMGPWEEYVNGVFNDLRIHYSGTVAQQQSVLQLQKKKLMLTVSRQRMLIFFLLLTIGLSAVIYALGIMAKRRKKLLMQKLAEMHHMNQQLQKLQQNLKLKQDTDSEGETESTIELKGGYNTIITTTINDLLYVEAVGNYTKVYQLKDGKVRSDMIRATSKQMEDMFNAFPTMVRCHRAFLVNLNQVEQIVSHQGLTNLIIRHCNDKIPVSRRYMAQMKAALENI